MQGRHTAERTMYFSSILSMDGIENEIDTDTGDNFLFN